MGRILHEVTFEQRLAGSEGEVTERRRPSRRDGRGVRHAAGVGGAESEGQRGIGARRAPPQVAGRKELMVGTLVLASPWKGDMSRSGCLKVTGVAVQGICPGASAEMGFKKDPRGRAQGTRFPSGQTGSQEAAG